MTLTPKNPLAREFGNKRIHILGVAGTLMGSFAAYLKRQGIAVTGTDQNIYPPMSDVLKNAGVEVYTGYAAENLSRARPDLVIVGNVIRKTNPEMEAVAAQGIKYLSLPSAFETMILPHKHSIVVAGTHGKTTTTTMMSHMLEFLGENPSFFIGGVPQGFSESFRVTESKYMALEGDEYDTAFFDKVPKFTHYRPNDAILTSVEFDHADIYKDLNAVIAAFNRLAELVPAGGNLVVCSETELPVQIARQCTGKVITYGFDDRAQSRATDVTLSPEGAQFTWEGHRVKLAASGRHNVLNALACLTLAKARGLDVKRAVESFASFGGIKRRQEVYGQAAGVTLIDDFAHHPTAVKETLAAIRSRYPKNKIIACFEPRSATSRRRVFQKAYSESFDLADAVYIAKPYDQTTINPQEMFSSDELIADLQQRGRPTSTLDTSQTGIESLAKTLNHGDVVLVMSNGGFDGLLPKLLKALTTLSS